MAHGDVHRPKAKFRRDQATPGDEADGGACKQDWWVERWASNDGRFRAGGREPVLQHRMPVASVTVLWHDQQIPSSEAGSVQAARRL
jgi:hypothetical protein